jgi:hypothetical protein
MQYAGNLDALNRGGWGVFIASTTKTAVGEGCCRWAHRTVRCATEHCPVCQPRHPTVRVLTVSTVGALTAWATGQSGVAPDNYCSLSGAPSGAALTSTRTVRALFTLQATVGVDHCSTGTPDSPVNYSRARPQKPKGEEFEVDPPWCTGQSGAPDQGSLRILLLLSFEP